MLPDPQALAIRAHKRIETELFDLYFRENPIPGLEEDLCKRIQINYDSASANVDGPLMMPLPRRANLTWKPARPKPRTRAHGSFLHNNVARSIHVSW